MALGTESVELSTAYVRILPSLRGGEKAIAQQIAGNGRVTETAGRTIGGRILGGLKTSAKVGAAGFAAILGTALTKGFKRLSSIENAEASLTGLGHSGKAVSAIMKNALASVKGTAFGMDEAASTAAGAVAAGIKPGKELEAVLKLVGDAATIGGTSMGEMGAIFNKVATSNKVQGDVIAQLSDRGIPIVQLLAKELGISAEETVELASAGKINFATFRAAMEDGLGGAALASGDTATGAWKNMLAALSRVGATLMMTVYPSLKMVFGGATDMLDRLNEKIGPFAEKFGIELAGGIRAFGAAWAYNDGEVTSSGFPGFMEKAAYHTRQLVDGIRGLDFSSFRGFIDSLAGAGGGEALASMSDSFQKLRPAAAEFLRLLPEMGGALATLSAAGLGLVVRGLEFLAQHVDIIIAWMPAIVGAFIAWKIASLGVAAASTRLQLAQVQMAPVLLANNILRLTAIHLENRQTAATAANTVATNVQAAAVTKAGLAAKIAAAGQWVLNLALRANPIGIVITAIGALVGALVWFFTKTEVGQRIVKTVWSGIQQFVGGVARWFSTYVLPHVQTVFRAVGGVFKWLYEKVVRPVFGFIGAAIKAWWMLGQGIFRVAIAFIQRILAPAIVWLYQRNVQPIFSAIGRFIGATWNNVIRPAFQAVKNFISGVLGPAFRWFNTSIVRPVFSAVGSLIRSVWTGRIQPIFTAIRTAIRTTLPNAFNSGVGFIKTHWNKLREIAAVPVRFVVNTVLNKGLIDNFNKVARFLKVAELPPVALPAGMAGGGIIPGYDPRKRDTVLTPMRKGEGVLVPEVVRGVGKRFIDVLNRAGNSGGVRAVRALVGAGRALGGLIHPVPGAVITSGYRTRQRPDHDGIDYAAPLGTPIRAAGAGRVQMSGWGSGGAGNTVILNHLGGIQTVYYHMLRTIARTGAMVNAGSRIGLLGSTGNSTGPHLHFTVRRNGRDINPATMLSGGGGVLQSLNPLEGITSWLTDQISAAFPAASGFVNMIMGVGKKIIGDAAKFITNAAGNIVDAIVPDIFDNGGWLESQGMGINRTNKPEPVLTNEEWTTFKGIADNAAGGGDTYHLHNVPMDHVERTVQAIRFERARQRRGGVNSRRVRR